MADEAVKTAGAGAAGKDDPSLAAMRDGLGLRCPPCGYILVGVEEAGLKACPECGVGLDFEQLRQGHAPLDLNAYGPWQIMWRFLFFSRGFLDLVVTRRYVELRVPDRNPYLFWAMVPMLIMAVPFTLVAWRIGGPVSLGLIPVAGVALFLAAHLTIRPWLGWLLSMAGHLDPSAGARRIAYVLSSQYVPMAVNIALAAVGVLLMSITSPDKGIPGLWQAAAVVVFATSLIYFILWGSWVRVGGELFRVETQWRPTAARYWLFANPGLILAVPAPLVLFVLVLILG